MKVKTRKRKVRRCHYCGNKLEFVHIRRLIGYPLSAEIESATAYACRNVKWYQMGHHKFIDIKGE